MLDARQGPGGYPGFSGDAVLHILGASVPAQTLWIIGITLAFLVLAHLFFERTILGKSLRAVAADREAASLVGINVRHSVMWSFVIGALAGGVAGTIITPLTFTSYDQGALIGFKGFSAAMLGGIGNLYGALVGGLRARPAGDVRGRLRLVSLQGRGGLRCFADHPVRAAVGLAGRPGAERV